MITALITTVLVVVSFAPIEIDNVESVIYRRTLMASYYGG